LKRNITYYPHYVDSHNHWKFKLLRSPLGWEAEGKFWALNNMIAASENCVLKLSKKQIRAAVMNDLSLSSEQFERFITILTHECELIIDLDGCITTDIVRDSLQLVMKDREESRKRKQKEKEITQTKIFSI
jgi:uncharacterized protein YxjI